MMGRSHAASGALSWAVAATAASGLGLAPTWPTILIGSLATAGAALIPDADHSSASLAHCWGFASRRFCRTVAQISGGHRHATHGLWFAAFAALTAWLFVDAAPWIISGVGGPNVRPWLVGVALYVLMTLGLRSLHLVRSGAHALAVLIATIAALTVHGTGGWLPIAVAVGTLAHIVGDCFTTGGCPILWPNTMDYRFHLGHVVLIRKTGNRTETMLVAPLMSIATFGLLGLHAWSTLGG